MKIQMLYKIWLSCLLCRKKIKKSVLEYIDKFIASKQIEKYVAQLSSIVD